MTLPHVAVGDPHTAAHNAERDQINANEAEIDAVAASLAPVATSNAYGDLSGKPALGTAASKNVGTTAGTVAAGDDARITGAAQASALGTAAAKNVGTASGDVPLLGAGGVLPMARIATGAPDGTKFVRDDGTLATPAGGGGGGSGDVVGPAVAVSGRVATFSGTSGKIIADSGVTLGTAAAKNTGTASGDIPLLAAGGVLPVARLATGAPDGTKFVRDDGTLATPTSGSGDVVGPAGATNGMVPVFSGATGKLLADVGIPSTSITGAAQKAANLFDLPSPATARTNLSVVADKLGGVESILEAAGSGAKVLDCALYSGMVLTALTGAVTVSLSNTPSTAGKMFTFTVAIVQGVTVQAITWPTVKWAGNVAPTDTASKTLIVTLWKYGVDTTLYGSYGTFG